MHCIKGIDISNIGGCDGEAKNHSWKVVWSLIMWSLLFAMLVVLASPHSLGGYVSTEHYDWRREAGLGDGKNRGSGAKLPGSKSWLCPLFPVWLWGKYLTSLCLCFFICKMGLILTALTVLRGLLWLNKPMQSTYKSAQFLLSAQKQHY